MEIPTVVWQLRYIQIINVLLYLFKIITAEVAYSENGLRKRVEQYGVYYSLQSILDRFNSEEYKNNPKVAQLLDAFENTCKAQYKDVVLPPGLTKQYPFFVCEGDLISRRHVLAIKLAAALNAKLMNTIPECLFKFRLNFNDNLKLKRLFFALAAYATSMNAHNITQYEPAVIPGYWWHQSTYYLTREFMKDPIPLNSSVFDFPEDLLMPDVVIYLNAHKYTDADTIKEFYTKVAETYHKMRGPVMHEVKLTFINSADIESIVNKIRDSIGSKYENFSV